MITALGSRKAIERLLAFAALGVFLIVSVRAGWMRAETDFPNYYTAARLVKEGAPLHNYYDWTWFQKQMNYAGIENQLGGYIPQTPLTMLPMLGIASFKVQTAKRIWLALNLVLLGLSVWMMARLTRLSTAQIWLLAFAGYGTLHVNFLLGQYYVFLLFLLVLAFKCLDDGREYTSGFLFGAAFVLKLYGAPFALYFAAKRRWRAFAGMIAASLTLIALSIVIFGWKDNVYFATQILPRAIQGETLDPYNSGNGTISTLLRRTFMLEPELNPHSLWDAPRMFFFLQPFMSVLVLAVPLFLLWRRGAEKPAFAWFCIAMLLASPNTASYTFILLLLPVVLLLKEAGLIERVILIGCYVLLSLPIGPTWNVFFPRVFLLLILFFLAAERCGPLIRASEIMAVVALATVVAAFSGWRQFESYMQEPGRRWERVAMQRGAIYSSSPAILRSGIVYQSIGRAHYVLRWQHDGGNEEFAFAGEAFHPIACSPDGPIQFELVAHGASTTMLFDVLTRKLTDASPPFCASASSSITSPDGKWVVFVPSGGGSRQIWLRKSAGGPATRLAGGSCNSFSPVWELDSKGIVFASDCDRGIGLPALYRASVEAVR